MDIRRPPAARVQDAAFLAACLAYVWAGIDPRLIYHWQRPVFYTSPGFLDEFLRYPGGPADYLYALVAQAYAFAGWGAIVVTAQVAAVLALTEVYFTTLAGGALPLVRYVPAVLLVSEVNLYHDRTPMALALSLGLALAILFVRLSRRWSNGTALLAAFAAMLVAAYYLAGVAMVFFAPAAAMVLIARRPTRLPGIACLLLAAALPAAAEWLRLASAPVSVRAWFTDADVRRVVVWWGLYGFYALGTAMVLGVAHALLRAVPARRAAAKRREESRRGTQECVGHGSALAGPASGGWQPAWPPPSRCWVWAPWRLCRTISTPTTVIWPRWTTTVPVRIGRRSSTPRGAWRATISIR